MSPVTLPSRALERQLFAEGATFVAGIDEVGRGAWAGPLYVGVAVVGRCELEELPPDVRDSKLCTPRQRAALAEATASAVRAHACGVASALECDELGMTAAQSLAARRALEALAIRPDVVVLDGVVDYLGDSASSSAVRLVAHGDRDVATVAAASVIAKVTRDRLMCELAPRYPAYRFERNKGYASLAHRRAVARLGFTGIHRRSFAVRLLEDA